MTVFKNYLKKKIYFQDNIYREKSLLFNNLYRKEREKISNKILPFGWHWLYFNENVNSANLSIDGHTKRGFFFPKLKGYKRMYVGSELIHKNNFHYNMNVKIY